MTGDALDVPFSVVRGEEEISTARARLDLGVIHEFLATAYWSEGIPRGTVERALAGSLNFGLYRAGKQIGLARVVTDAATFAYVADVFVLPEFRGRGLARWLVSAAQQHPGLTGLRRWLLVTRDAQSIYADCGFVPVRNPERFMEISRPDVYRTSDR